QLAFDDGNERFEREVSRTRRQALVALPRFFGFGVSLRIFQLLPQGIQLSSGLLIRAFGLELSTAATAASAATAARVIEVHGHRRFERHLFRRVAVEIDERGLAGDQTALRTGDR